MLQDAPYHTRSVSLCSTEQQEPQFGVAPVNLNSSCPGEWEQAPAPQQSWHQSLAGRVRGAGRAGEQGSRGSLARPGLGDTHKSPRTQVLHCGLYTSHIMCHAQELEEFAAKFEGYHAQRRVRLAVQPTPMLDQLARETGSWQVGRPTVALCCTALPRA